jgi:hypothetical protein
VPPRFPSSTVACCERLPSGPVTGGTADPPITGETKGPLGCVQPTPGNPPYPVGSPGLRLHSATAKAESGVNPAPVTVTDSPEESPVEGVTATVGDVGGAGAPNAIGTVAMSDGAGRVPDDTPNGRVPKEMPQVTPARIWAAVGGHG